MSKFMYIYHGPSTPEAESPSDAADMEAVMAEWMAWAQRVGDDLLDFGTPLSEGIRVTPDGSSPSDRQVTGYSIIEAPDLDAALELASDHPHLRTPGGCEIEIHEFQPIPGM